LRLAGRALIKRQTFPGCRIVKTTTSTRSSDSPINHRRSSFAVEWLWSSAISTNGSSNAVIPSSKLTRCLRRLEAAFVSSQSNRINSMYRKARPSSNSPRTARVHFRCGSRVRSPGLRPPDYSDVFSSLPAERAIRRMTSFHEAIAVAFDGDDLSAVDEAIHQGDHASGVGEDVGPLGKDFVG